MKLETSSKKKLGLKGLLKIQFRITVANQALWNSLSEFYNTGLGCNSVAES